MTHLPALLRKGWPESRVRERYLERARAVNDDFEFRTFTEQERPTIEQLLNEQLINESTFTMSAEAGGIKASHNGELAGAIVLEGVETPGDGIAVRVTAVAVTPKWKGQGLGTVLLGMVPNFTTNVKFIYGGCAVDAAAFYQRAGYDVLQPGELLPFHLGGSLTGLASSNPHYPCWFIRHLR